MFIYIKVSRTDHFHIVVNDERLLRTSRFAQSGTLRLACVPISCPLEQVIHRKHRQIDRDDQESCKDRHQDQQCRFQHGDRLLYSPVGLACEVLADDVQCLIEFTGLFADGAHFLQGPRKVRAVFHAVPELFALLDLRDHRGDVLLQEVVVEHLRGDGDGVIQRQSGRKHRRHRIGEFRCAVHDIDLSDDREMQLDPALQLHAAFGLREELPRDHQRQHDDDEEHPPFREEVRHRDHHACHQRQLTAEAFEDLRERWDDLHHDDDQDDDGDAHDENRIRQCGAHLLAVFRAVLVVAVHPRERVIECTGQLARPHRLEEGERKRVLIFFEGMRDGRTALHVLCCIQQDLSKLFIIRLPGDHFHRAADRHAGFQRYRKL